MKSYEMLGGCVTDMLFYCSQLKMVHFLSQKNHHHTVIDEGRLELGDELDELVESLLGKYAGKLKPEQIIVTGKEKTFFYQPIKSQKDIMKYLNMMEQRAQKGLDVVKAEPELEFLADPIMDIIGIIAGMKYQIVQD
jgi:hypothetical protein